MKKLMLILVALLASSAIATAQEALAVLTHGGTTKTFTGYYALRNAYGSAADGDLITLSSGTFGATNIAKTVTIRGAGMRYDPTYDMQPTILDGDFSLVVPDSSTGTVQIEGIYHITTTTRSAARNSSSAGCISSGRGLTQAVTEKAIQEPSRMHSSCTAG